MVCHNVAVLSDVKNGDTIIGNKTPKLKKRGGEAHYHQENREKILQL